MRLSPKILTSADLEIESALYNQVSSIYDCSNKTIELEINEITFFVVDGELESTAEFEDDTIEIEYTKTFELLEKLVNKKFRERQSELILETGDY
jgi:hypothetical protein